MTRLRLIFLVGFIALISSATTIFLIKYGLFTESAFDARWTALKSDRPSESPAIAAPSPQFTQLTVVDGTRGVLTYGEQQSLYNGLSERLIDPVSAQIRKLVRSKDQSLIICGEINSKNRFGGYVGFVPFFAGVLPQKADVVITSADVGSQMPRMGCPDENSILPANSGPVEVEKSKFGERTRDASPDHVTGQVTVENYDQLSELIGRNPGKIIGLSISFENRPDASDLHTYAYKGTFNSSLEGYGRSVFSATSGFRLEKGRFVFNGYFLIHFEGMGQGSGFYSFESIDDKQVRFAKEVRVIELK